MKFSLKRILISGVLGGLLGSAAHSLLVGVLVAVVVHTLLWGRDWRKLDEQSKEG